MGRLRKLSANFKAAAFHNSNNSESSPASFVGDESTNSGSNVTTKEVPPPAIREASNSSIPTTNVPPVGRDSRSASRPTSMIYTPPSMDTGRDNHIEELVPVFSFLSSHSNKLYQEGYFLKLNDLDTNGKPNADRNWTECFAQLVGTVLSLWDAAALDAAGQDGEVAPTFVNLADASIKMIETLPTRNSDVQPLQNVLSISTAGKNRYLLHFNSLHSLTQWTAGIRLAMFEHASLQELYTGSLIAGKGKTLNNIRSIMERTKFRHEDWARVRFGAGTPWRRCWCVIEPPDEKEWQRAVKTMKKRSAYERPSYPKGDIKFYDTKKTKKTSPIATITDAYSAYAIYPQSKPLIDQSTLVKLEGKITIHSNPESKTEGFVFVMPEVHPAVSGFEMMLRWLFPVYDIFQLYGRPNRLIADTLDAKGLMFAMPKERRYGYLDIIDVAALIHTNGSDKWSEREWRKQMKEMTSRRMTTAMQDRTSSTLGSRRANRHSMASRTGVHYDEREVSDSMSPVRQPQAPNMSSDAVFATQRKVTAPLPAPASSVPAHVYHQRSVSESVTLASPSKGNASNGYVPRMSIDQESPEPIEPTPTPPSFRQQPHKNGHLNEVEAGGSANSSDTDLQIQRTRSHAQDVQQDLIEHAPPTPVAAPPSFHHNPSDKPPKQPATRPEMRREKSRMSNATLEQMMEASRAGNGNAAGTAAAMAWRTASREQAPPNGVGNDPSNGQTSANQTPKAMVADYRDARRPADVRPSETIRQASAASVADSSASRGSSQHSIKRKPLPSLAPPPVPVMRTMSNDRTSNYSNPERHYDSDESPDYASTADAKSEKSVPKPRAGVLKTVGTAGVSADAPPVPPKSDIPEIDFGVTQSLTPGSSRPSTALGQLGFGSPSGSGQTTPERRTARTPEALPSDEKRASYFGHSNNLPSHSRSTSQAWQPGAMPGQQNPGPGLSPEEFVQQRYAAASRPVYHAQQRSISAGRVEQTATTPKKLHKQHSSRPSSRNSGTLLDFSTNLSAREQEQVARMTGGPLLNMGERNRTPDPSVGLIGAIEAREQEKRQVRDGVSGHMVQAAIAQRQQHAQAEQMQAQRAAERAFAQQPYGYQQYPQQFTSWGASIQPTRSAPVQNFQQQYQSQYPQQQYQGQRRPQQSWDNQASQRYYQQQQRQQHQQKYGGYYNA